MEKDKGRREYIICIINSEAVYCNAFETMYQSIISNSPLLLERKWVVLYTEDNEEGIEHLIKKYQNIEFISYPEFQSVDKYELKFLLINYIESIEDSESIITYLDTDHIFLRNMDLIEVENGRVILSSEKRKLSINGEKIIHYNASFVRATINTWKAFMLDWKKTYSALEGKVNSRFREEIAFSIAIRDNKVQVTPLSGEIQSNFQNYHLECICFHYGGEYSSAKKMKNVLVGNDISIDTLTNQEKWLISQIQFNMPK